ncbi:porin family protein [Fusobacteria bacterium ZRK30]|nr:porin family protein [Fusobacteria bacterium ZRK30]
MKKVLLGLVALSALSFGAKGDTYLNARFGGDLGAEYTKIYTKDNGEDVPILNNETKGFGGEIAIEGYRGLTDNFDLGLGLAYQFHGDREDKSNGTSQGNLDSKGGEYNSVPLYLIAKYNFHMDSEFTPYLKANLGYSFNMGSSDIEYSFTDANKSGKTETEVENGLYWAIGGGMEYHNFTVELMYALNKAKSEIKGENEKEDNDYGRLVLSAGYRFNL